MTETDAGPASPTTPADAAGTDPFRDLLPRLCLIGAVTHVGFLTLFVFTHIPVLVGVNILSILCYVGILALVRRNRTRPIVEFVLVAAEVLSHAVVASIVIGWESGFHYYVLLLIPVTAVSGIQPTWLKTAAVASSGLGYLGIDLWLRPSTAAFTLPGHALAILYYFNVLSALLILAGLAGWYYMLINHARSALQVMATTDPLTQLHNRTSLGALIRQQESRAQRGHPLSFVMCDIDHFKDVNDHGGHAAGDEVLKYVSSCLAANVRKIDHIGRWGGEEFLVILPDASDAAAGIVAERLCAEVAGLPVLLPGGPSRITVTIGVATMEPAETASQAIARADDALYHGKRAGRNRVIMAAAAPVG